MKNWSNKQHEKMLEEKRRKKFERKLETLDRASVPTTIYLDNIPEDAVVLDTRTIDRLQGNMNGGFNNGKVI